MLLVFIANFEHFVEEIVQSFPNERQFNLLVMVLDVRLVWYGMVWYFLNITM